MGIYNVPVSTIKRKLCKTHHKQILIFKRKTYQTIKNGNVRIFNDITKEIEKLTQWYTDSSEKWEAEKQSPWPNTHTYTT